MAVSLEDAGFVNKGEIGPFYESTDTTYKGSFPVNTDGGLLANGEPIGASGLRQVHEVCLQLRGQAGRHQVPGKPKTGFTHVYGFPGSKVKYSPPRWLVPSDVPYRGSMIRPSGE